MSEEVVHALVVTTLLIVAGALAIALTMRLISAIRADEPIGISSHWGGLGGGTGGWRLSPALVSLIGAVTTWLLCAAVGLYYVEGSRERETQRIARADAVAAIEREERHRSDTRSDERERIAREERQRQQECTDDTDEKRDNLTSPDEKVARPARTARAAPQNEPPPPAPSRPRRSDAPPAQ